LPCIVPRLAASTVLDVPLSVSFIYEKHIGWDFPAASQASMGKLDGQKTQIREPPFTYLYLSPVPLSAYGDVPSDERKHPSPQPMRS